MREEFLRTAGVFFNLSTSAYRYPACFPSGISEARLRDRTQVLLLLCEEASGNTYPLPRCIQTSSSGAALLSQKLNDLLCLITDRKIFFYIVRIFDDIVQEAGGDERIIIKPYRKRMTGKRQRVTDIGNIAVFAQYSFVRLYRKIDCFQAVF